MVLPIVAYGNQILKKISVEINSNFPNLDVLITDMWETMYFSKGVGLAAPQVNHSIRLFIVDATPFADEDEKAKEFKKVFINPQIINEEGEEWSFNEGCLSVPDIREDVFRKPVITIKYYDQNWNLLEETYNGIVARIIQHEYDHLEGIVFVEKLSGLRKTLLKRKINNIVKGNIDINYRMIFANNKK